MRFTGKNGGGGHLEWKVWIFSVAAVLALVGIYLDERWMTATALALLASAMLLRFIAKGDGADTDTDTEGDDDETSAGM